MINPSISDNQRRNCRELAGQGNLDFVDTTVWLQQLQQPNQAKPSQTFIMIALAKLDGFSRIYPALSACSGSCAGKPRAPANGSRMSKIQALCACVVLARRIGK